MFDRLCTPGNIACAEIMGISVYYWAGLFGNLVTAFILFSCNSRRGTNRRSSKRPPRQLSQFVQVVFQTIFSRKPFFPILFSPVMNTGQQVANEHRLTFLRWSFFQRLIRIGQAIYLSACLVRSACFDPLSLDGSFPNDHDQPPGHGLNY